MYTKWYAEKAKIYTKNAKKKYATNANMLQDAQKHAMNNMLKIGQRTLTCKIQKYIVKKTY